jgi:hypothetical protein
MFVFKIADSMTVLVDKAIAKFNNNELCRCEKLFSTAKHIIKLVG